MPLLELSARACAYRNGIDNLVTIRAHRGTTTTLGAMFVAYAS